MEFKGVYILRTCFPDESGRDFTVLSEKNGDLTIVSGVRKAKVLSVKTYLRFTPAKYVLLFGEITKRDTVCYGYDIKEKRNKYYSTERTVLLLVISPTPSFFVRLMEKTVHL